MYPSPTTINATKGLGEVLIYVNQVTENWISNMILIAVYILVLVGFYKANDDFGGAMAVAGFGTFVIALLFWLGGFVSGWALGISIAMALIGIIVIITDKG